MEKVTNNSSGVAGSLGTATPNVYTFGVTISLPSKYHSLHSVQQKKQLIIMWKALMRTYKINLKQIVSENSLHFELNKAGVIHGHGFFTIQKQIKDKYVDNYLKMTCQDVAKLITGYFGFKLTKNLNERSQFINYTQPCCAITVCYCRKEWLEYISKENVYEPYSHQLISEVNGQTPGIPN